MKYCVNCGRQLEDEAAFCTSCGKATAQPDEAYAKKNGTLDNAIKAFMVMNCVLAVITAVVCFLALLFITAYSVDAGIGVEYKSDFPTVSALCMVVFFLMSIAYLVSLAWRIPLTVYVFRRMKKGRPIRTGAKLCILIFVDTVTGVLLLCRTEPNK